MQNTRPQLLAAIHVSFTTLNRHGGRLHCLPPCASSWPAVRPKLFPAHQPADGECLPADRIHQMQSAVGPMGAPSHHRCGKPYVVASKVRAAGKITENVVPRRGPLVYERAREERTGTGFLQSVCLGDGRASHKREPPQACSPRKNCARKLRRQEAAEQSPECSDWCRFR